MRLIISIITRIGDLKGQVGNVLIKEAKSNLPRADKSYVRVEVVKKKELNKERFADLSNCKLFAA